MSNTHMLRIDAIAQLSGLGWMNAGLKMLIGSISLLACISSKAGSTAFIVLAAMIYVTVKLAAIELRLYGQLLKIPVFFLFLSIIVVLFEISAKSMGFLSIDIGFVYLCITKASLSKAFLLSLRSIGGVSCLYMISLTTPLAEIIHVFHRLKIPDIVVELLYLMYRYIMLLLEQHNSMKISAQCRSGYDGYKNTFRSMCYIGRSLLLLSFQKAVISYDAMAARGYDGSMHFWQSKKPLHKKECVLTAGYFFVLLCSIAFEWGIV